MAASVPYSGDDLFATTEAPLIETPAERRQRKPSGTSDQGYSED